MSHRETTLSGDASTEGGPTGVPEQVVPWRSELLDQLLRIVFWLGVVVAVPGIGFAIFAREVAIIVIDVLAITAVGIVTFRPNIGYHRRSVVLLTVAFTLGVFFTIQVGVVGQVYLLAFPVFATLLLGMRAALIALGINAVTLTVIGLADIADPVLAVPGLDGWQEWLVVMLNFLFVNAVMALSSAILIRRLERSLVDEQALSHSLAERNEELERSEQIRLAFLRATSHELRTPLSAIVGFAQTLRDRADRLAGDQREQLLDRMAINADRLGALITDLLDVDRLSNGLVTASRRPNDLAALVRNVVEEIGPEDRRRVVLDLQSVDAEVDAPKVERAIINLVANALRHTPSDGRVHVSTFHRGGEGVVRVDDEGTGIDPRYRHAIFEPFVQGPDRHDDPKPGTGLGLSLARELIRLHDGEVDAHNLQPFGARFEITLPL